LQLDEKWSFVGKKEKNCSPQDEADACLGERWDFIALDPDSRLVLGVVVGKRVGENAVALLEDVKRRLGDRTPGLITSDEWSAYPGAIREVFGEEVTPERTGKPGRPAGPRVEAPEGLNYATVHKTREKGRVVSVATRVVMGLMAVVMKLLGGGKVNTSYIERQNATDRHQNARKGRKTYRFSKDRGMHEAMTGYTMYSYNFCWPVRTLRVKGAGGRWRQRTPAMVAGLTDHVWSLKEWVSFPTCQRL
jgi:IS1 family transposase